MVITTAQLHSNKPELRFCAGSNPARGVSEVRDDADPWQWSRLEIRLIVFRPSTIPQKQFIILFIIKNSLSPIIINEILNFQKSESYNLRSGIHLPSRNMHTAHFSSATISSSGPKLWKLVSDKIRHVNPRIDLGPSETAHVNYAKYMLKILALLKFVRVSNGIHTNAYSFFLKTGKKVLK